MDPKQLESLRECCRDPAAFERLQKLLISVETQHQHQLQFAESQVRALEAKLEQQVRFSAMLKRITDRVRLSLEPDEILPIVMQELVLTLGVICCDTGLYNLSEGTSTISYEYTATSNTGITRWNAATPSALGLVVPMTDFPYGYRQLLAGQYFQFCEITPHAIRTQVAILAVPIADDLGVIGDVWVFNYKDYAFSETEIRLVQQVTSTCAIALRQARLFQATVAQVKELKKLNSIKDEFLNTVSHELRTPLSNINMAIQLLQIAPDSERQQGYIKILELECEREVALINDLLDLQRLSANSFPTQNQELVNIREILPSIIEPLRVRTQQQRQTLRLSLAEDLPTFVSDRASLERILTELLNNACKYTKERGEIVLGICYEEISVFVKFTISNEAEIPADHLPHIFEKFYRVVDLNSEQQEGTGLGLALVQKLVEQLQGRISVESSNGWTTFTVELPNLPLA